MPGEVAWRGLSAQAQGVALPSSPGECRDPRSRSTCRAGPGSRAARERIRARIRARSRGRSRARAATFACFSPTSKFIHKTLRLSQPKEGELGRGGESISLPPPPPPSRFEGLVPAQNLRQHPFLPALGGRAERGGRRGTGLGSPGGQARGGVGSGEEEERGFNSGFTLSNRYLRKGEGGKTFPGPHSDAPPGSLRPSQS